MQELHPGVAAEGRRWSSRPGADIKVGNALPLENIPTGTLIHNVELKPGQGAKMARSTGSGIQLVAGRPARGAPPVEQMRRCCRRAGDFGHGNVDHQNITVGKAGRSHGRQALAVRGSAMTRSTIPHGGEGNRRQRHPVPVGVPTLGKRTRAKHKESNKLIVRSRRRGKEGRR